MRMVTVAAVQMHCSRDVTDNLERAEQLVRQAAAQGANVILLPELFERQYFCQERQYDYYQYATPLLENPAVQRFQKVAAELQVVLPISFYERAGNNTFNRSLNHFYQEKFYFTPGDTGFRVWNTRYGCIGVGICWDQWFPETARCMALQGAELLFYPTAIGSEPLLGMDSFGHWQRCMQGHAAANLMPVIAANRIGTETVEPCEANQNQQSELTFYGTSFITDQTGAVLEQAGRTEDTVLLHTFDLDAIQKDRLEWGLFRDRRPEQYGAISSPIPVQI